MASDEGRVRLDKWLWAARFYKTRALAREAIEGGKVHCQGVRCKPSKEPKIGEQYEVRCGSETRTVIVQGLSAQRQNASLAAHLYEETAASLVAREQAAALRKANAYGMLTEGRPNKKQRRQLQALHERN